MAAPLRQKFVLQIFSIKSCLPNYTGVVNIGSISKHCKTFWRISPKLPYSRTFFQHRGNLDYNVCYKGTSIKGGNFCKQLVLRSRALVQPLSILSVSEHSYATSGKNKHQHYGYARTVNRDYSSGTPQEDSKDAQKDNKTENIYTIPNALTLCRVMLTPVIGVLVVQQNFPAALTLFTFAGFTDWLDGYIARNYAGQMSAFGTAMDPLADKILISVLTITLTAAHLLPVPLAVLILGRDILLVISGFVIRYLSLPPPFTLRRYFDGTVPTVKVLPSTLSKWNTGLQLSLVCLTLAAPVFEFVNHPVLQALWVVTGVTTMGSGIDYVINRNKYIKYLKKR